MREAKRGAVTEVTWTILLLITANFGDISNCINHTDDDDRRE